MDICHSGARVLVNLVNKHDSIILWLAINLSKRQANGFAQEIFTHENETLIAHSFIDGFA